MVDGTMAPAISNGTVEPWNLGTITLENMVPWHHGQFTLAPFHLGNL